VLKLPHPTKWEIISMNVASNDLLSDDKEMMVGIDNREWKQWYMYLHPKW